MAASGNQPVSAANLAAALGVSASGSIGSQPISVDNLKAVLGAFGGQAGMTVLYDGEPTSSAQLSRPFFDGFDAWYAETVEQRIGVLYGVISKERLEYLGESRYFFPQSFDNPEDYYQQFNIETHFTLSGDRMTLTVRSGDPPVSRIIGIKASE